jgi:N-acetylglutamate synthase-like GNAT family acetyltransferase
VSVPALPVRRAVAADIPGLLGLIHSAYRGASSRAGWTTEADLIDGSRTTAELLAADLADPAVTVLVAEDAGGLLGCCAVTDRGGGTAYFGTFAVRPTAQGGGVGSQLLTAAMARARAAGAVRMEMTVLAQRPELLAWYGRRGFASTGERRAFPYGDERYGSPLRDDLEFTVLRASLAGAGKDEDGHR